MDNDNHTNKYRFGDFELNTFDRTLIKSKKSIRIPSKSFDVLLFLIKNCGKTIAKAALMDEIWNESFVEEGNLSVHISKLRKLLGATQETPFIKTVSGQGYQFVMAVERISEDKNDKKSTLQNFSAKETAFRADSIAVLPIKNENGDEEIDYLADGLTESLINSLSYMPDFRVLARETVFRYKDKDVNAQEVGKELGVSTVLTGRLRVVKDNLILGIELINVKDATQIWGTQINEPFSDIFIMRENLSATISTHLLFEKLNTTFDPQPREFTENAESYRLYLKGKYLLAHKTRKNIQLAIKYFQDAIAMDSKNVRSYVGIGECYSWLQLFEYIPHKDALPIIENYISRACKIAEETPELYVLRGDAARNLYWDFNQAESFYSTAISLNPNYSDAYRAKANVLIVKGRFSDALNVASKLKELDPISSTHNVTIGRIFYFSGKYENALEEFSEAIELDPNNFIAIVLIGCVHLELADYSKAITYFRKARNIQTYVEFDALISHTHGRAGNLKEAQSKLELLLEKAKSEYVPFGLFVYIYAGMAENNKAFEYLELAFQNKEESLVVAKVNPTLASLRSDPRFNDLLKRIGLPLD